MPFLYNEGDTLGETFLVGERREYWPDPARSLRDALLNPFGLIMFAFAGRSKRFSKFTSML